MIAALITSQHLDDADGWNPFLYNTITRLSSAFHIMAPDDVVTQGAKPSAVMVLSKLSQNAPVLAPRI